MAQSNQPSPFGGSSAYPAGGSTNLGDILERVLDKGLVIAGDIRVNLLDIELLTVKLRLVIASLETAREVGMDWWRHDPWFTGTDHELEQENQRLRRRLAALEADADTDTELRAVEGGGREREREADEQEDGER